MNKFHGPQANYAPEGLPAGGVAPADGGAPIGAPVGPAWYEGKVDAETLGHWQNRGWHTKSAEEVAIEATKAHREAERFIGAPANELLRMPKADADAVTLQSFWGRLGAPNDKTGYDLSGVKFADGTPLDDAFVQTFRETAASLHLPKDAAAGVAQAFVKFLDNADMAEATEHSAALQTERDALAKSWGPNYNANLLVAQNTARALGLDPDTVGALEKQIGYTKVLEMFRTIGTKIGEDKFVSGNSPAGPGVMTREQAVASKADLMKDTAWVQRYLANGAAELRQMLALNTLIVGDDTDASRGR